MNAEPEKPVVFLERKRYRAQRMRDVAKMLPILGIVLLFIPLLWRGDAQTSNAFAVQYIFGTWILLLVLTGFVSRRLAVSEANDQD